eukprot:m.161715 g.161715  ORF g.161715 m.161715 type:complete len:341 (-) comp12109_c0_seq1:1192-2214(-)
MDKVPTIVSRLVEKLRHNCLTVAIVAIEHWNQQISVVEPHHTEGMEMLPPLWVSDRFWFRHWHFGRCGHWDGREVLQLLGRWRGRCINLGCVRGNRLRGRQHTEKRRTRVFVVHTVAFSQPIVRLKRTQSTGRPRTEKPVPAVTDTAGTTNAEQAQTEQRRLQLTHSFARLTNGERRVGKDVACRDIRAESVSAPTAVRHAMAMCALPAVVARALLLLLLRVRLVAWGTTAARLVTTTASVSRGRGGGIRSYRGNHILDGSRHGRSHIRPWRGIVWSNRHSRVVVVDIDTNGHFSLHGPSPRRRCLVSRYKIDLNRVVVLECHHNCLHEPGTFTRSILAV